MPASDDAHAGSSAGSDATGATGASSGATGGTGASSSATSSQDEPATPAQRLAALERMTAEELLADFKSSRQGGDGDETTLADMRYLLKRMRADLRKEVREAEAAAAAGVAPPKTYEEPANIANEVERIGHFLNVSPAVRRGRRRGRAVRRGLAAG